MPKADKNSRAARGDGAAKPAGRSARTHRLLLDEAMKLVGLGGLVTVAEVAAAAGVSRATAYRYFPSRSRLIDAIMDESLGPVRRFESREEDGAARVRDLFERTFPLFKEFEPQMRAALQLSLEHWALERAGLLGEEQFKRGNRKMILGRNAQPLRKQLGAREFDRLLKALSLVYGIEPYVILKDMWGSSNREVDAITRWVAHAVIEKSLREGTAAGARDGASKKGHSGAAKRQTVTPDSDPAPESRQQSAKPAGFRSRIKSGVTSLP
jgi:AcrR family transcriptional regulator